MRITDYAALAPDTVIAAIEATGRRSDLRVFALNSYENRVYQVGIEDELPVIAKFYRPGRWSDAQIREEHRFLAELAAAELPVVAPLADAQGETLHTFAGYRYTLFPRKGGQAMDPSDPEQLRRTGMLLGRLHAIARAGSFHHRPRIDIDTFLDHPAQVVARGGFLPGHLAARHAAVIRRLRERLRVLLARDVRWMRTHGDCHTGNIFWTRDDGPWLVDFDDCRTAPAVQDLWMLMPGAADEQQRALAELLDGYETFCPFDRRELRLVEALRSLRLVHYAGWIAARWEDPAFPPAFPWFIRPGWWEEHVATLEEQAVLLDDGHPAHG